MPVPLLVSCDWLHEKIKTRKMEDVVLLDVSWASTKDCSEEFKKQHIPGTQHINVLCAEHSDLYPRNIPTADEFTKLAQKVGVSSNSHVIVYSNSDRAGYFLAGRGWWTFRYFGHKKVSILDGGLQKWLQNEFPVSDCVTDPQPGDFVAEVDNTMHKSFEDVKDNCSGSEKFQLIDSRANSAYTENQIPGAKNLVMADIIDTEKGVLKTVEELLQLFEQSGIDPKLPIVTHCNSGMSSCAVAFCAEYIGAERASVYHGGFTEWSKRQGKINPGSQVPKS